MCEITREENANPLYPKRASTGDRAAIARANGGKTYGSASVFVSKMQSATAMATQKKILR